MPTNWRPEPGVERAALLGVGEHGDSVPELRTVNGKRINPYPYKSPCYWVWYGANFAVEWKAVK